MADNRITPGRRKSYPEIQIGDRFGRLTALDAGHLVQMARQRVTYVRVKCDCGIEKDVRAISLKKGITISCGCVKVERAVARLRETSTTHGMSNTPVYRVYRTMLSRCYNPNVERYPIYGGRGISVCDRWRGDGGFENFLADMGPRPDGHSIERENSNGNYEPGNCRWANSKDQANNTARNRRIVWNGRDQTLAQWAEEIGIKAITIHMRLKSGWSIERALTEPLRGSS